MSIYFTFFLVCILGTWRKVVQATPVACPVCAVAIVSGLGFFRAIGVSDSIVGLWTGAILVAMASWFSSLLSHKKHSVLKTIFAYILTYILILPLYIGKYAVFEFNKYTILWVDSFIFSIIIGSLTLFSASKLYANIKRKRGKPHFPYEKVVLPITSLIFISLLFYFLGI